MVSVDIRREVLDLGLGDQVNLCPFLGNCSRERKLELKREPDAARLNLLLTVLRRPPFTPGLARTGVPPTTKPVGVKDPASPRQEPSGLNILPASPSGPSATLLWTDRWTSEQTVRVGSTASSQAAGL